MQRSYLRNADQMRPIQFQTGFTIHAEGSVLVSFGQTQVLCTASVVDKVPPHRKGKGGWLTAEYGMLPRATHTRSDREASKGKQSGRTQEIQRLIGRSLRAIVDIDHPSLGERTVHFDCDVLQADGGTRTASISGSYVALMLAAKKLGFEAAVLGQVAAVSVGIVQGHCVCDLDYIEDSSCQADVNVVMDALGQVIEVQGTAEGAPFSRSQLNTLLDLAQAGVLQIVAAQKQALA